MKPSPEREQAPTEEAWTLTAEEAKTDSLPKGKISKRETKITTSGRELEELQKGSPQIATDTNAPRRHGGKQ